MATIYIDQRPYEANERKNLLEVCLSLGFNLPYFCWHPAMGSVGACRQCAVKQFKDEQDTKGRLVMACMTPAADGTRIAIEEAEAKAFRAQVIEWLMANHPHDCPVCDEGGECHLQDMTVMTGHAYRRYEFTKRTYRNQELGPFIQHEMNRCIQCYRCVRFYRDLAGGRDLNVFASRDHVYFGRHEDGVLENEFSGNLVEVCPTGVFVDKTLMRHYTRKWDLQTAPSVCVHCGVGCNTIAGERYGSLRRIINRYNSQVNGYFLCDRGRFGYEFVNSDRRLRAPALHRGSDGALLGADAPRRLAPFLARRDAVFGIGSPRASLEANFALRTLVGADRFCIGLSERSIRLLRLVLDILRGPVRTPSIQEIEQADAALVLGEDLINTAPRLALALRQTARQQPMALVDKLKIPRWHDDAVRTAIQGQTGPMFMADVQGHWLDDVATETYHAAPDDLARLGFAIAHEVDPEAPAVSGLADDVLRQAQRIAEALKAASRPIVVSGLSYGSEAILQAAANVAWALQQHEVPAQLSYAVPECNSLGVALLGGLSLDAVCDAARAGKVSTVIVLENDLYRRMDAPAADGLLNGVEHVIVLDHIQTPTAAKAHAVLPVGTFAESDGTFINQEGRAQRFHSVLAPDPPIQESWRWLRDMGVSTGHGQLQSWHTLDDVIRALGDTLPAFSAIRQAAPPADFRIVGQKIPRQSHRYSGRTAMFADLTVHEPKPTADDDSPLAFSMEGFSGQPPSPAIPHFWAPGWNSIQALNKYQDEVGGPLRHEMPGVRLIEPEPGRRPYFSHTPAPFEPREGEWLIVPLAQIFGSDELSNLATAVAQRIPSPSLAMNPEDAAPLGLASGGRAKLRLANREYDLRVSLNARLPRGTAGFPLLPGSVPSLPAWASLERGAV